MTVTVGKVEKFDTSLADKISKMGRHGHSPIGLKELESHKLKRKFLEYLRRKNRYYFTDLIFSFIFATLMILIVRQTGTIRQLPNLSQGDLAPRVLRSPRQIEIVDEEATQLARSQVHRRVPPVYDFDGEVLEDLQARWIRAMGVIKDIYRLQNLKQELLTLNQESALNLDEPTVRLIGRLARVSDLQKAVEQAFAPITPFYIWDENPLKDGSIEILNRQNQKSEFVSADKDQYRFLSVREARQKMVEGALLNNKAIWSRWPMQERRQFLELMARSIPHNIKYNATQTQKRLQEALASVSPITTKISRGEIIAHRGERITPKMEAIIKRINNKSEGWVQWQRLPFEIGFASFGLWIVMLFLRFNFPNVLARSKDNVVAAGVILTSLALFKLTLFFQMDVVAGAFSGVPPLFFLFMIPVAAPVMIIRFLISPLIAGFAAVLFAVGMSMAMGDLSIYGVFVLISSLTGSFFMANVKTREAVHRAGYWTAMATGLSALFLGYTWSVHQGAAQILWRELSLTEFTWHEALWTFMAGAIAGWLSSAFTMVLTPFLENILDYTTDLRLLELVRMDHPLLKDLAVKAPGTYHHSIIVGTLAEAAAEAIGANALLARVGSYYHDIGKTIRPEYFTENVRGNESRHDHTSPQLSAKIIISHVKEGVLLAQRYKLGQPIIDMIEQHHGTSVVKFFYNKAQQEAAQPDSDVVVVDSDFRYPGPKPHAKEVAIVALADSCEAATRSLVDPTPARIQAMVHKIITTHLQEGVLDKASLTLEELKIIEEAFVRVLLGIHHNRIQYPDQEKGLPDANKTLAVVK